MFSLRGRTALVTGVGSGIGAAVAKAMAGSARRSWSVIWIPALRPPTPSTPAPRRKPKLAALTLARIPLGRWAEPDQIAPPFVYFASDAASYVTGQVLPVDGGTVI